MRKVIFLLIAVLGMAVGLEAQVVTSNANWADTLTNTENYTDTKGVTRDNNYLQTVQVVNRRLSGSAAGGLVLFYGSNNGVDFIATGDTIFITNDSISTGYVNLSETQFKFVKATVVQTATGVSIPRIYWYYKPE